MPFTEIERVEIAAIVAESLKAAGVAVPAAPTPAASPASQFGIKYGDQLTVHTRGGSCGACQTGWPTDDKLAPQVAIGTDPETGAAQFGPDPAWQTPDHARTCGSLVHSMLAFDNLQAHGYFLACEKPGCPYTELKVFPHGQA